MEGPVLDVERADFKSRITPGEYVMEITDAKWEVATFCGMGVTITFRDIKNENRMFSDWFCTTAEHDYRIRGVLMAVDYFADDLQNVDLASLVGRQLVVNVEDMGDFLKRSYVDSVAPYCG